MCLRFTHNLPPADSAGEGDWEAHSLEKHGRGKPSHSHETAWQADAFVSWEWHPLRGKRAWGLSAMLDCTLSCIRQQSPAAASKGEISIVREHPVPCPPDRVPLLLCLMSGCQVNESTSRADGGQKDPVLAVLLCVRDVRPILLDEFGDDLTHVTLYFD